MPEDQNNDQVNRFPDPDKEKRVYKRFSIQLPVQYKLAAFQENLTQASALDMSGNGLRLHIKDKPSIGEEMHLYINLPEKGQVVLASKVIWYKEVEGKPGYETGVKLADTTTEGGRKFVDFYTEKMLSFLDENRDEGTINS